MTPETTKLYRQWEKLANQVSLRQRVFNAVTEDRKQDRIRAAMVRFEKALAAEQGKPYFSRYI